MAEIIAAGVKFVQRVYCFLYPEQTQQQAPHGIPLSVQDEKLNTLSQIQGGIILARTFGVSGAVGRYMG